MKFYTKQENRLEFSQKECEIYFNNTWEILNELIHTLGVKYGRGVLLKIDDGEFKINQDQLFIAAKVIDHLMTAASIEITKEDFTSFGWDGK